MNHNFEFVVACCANCVYSELAPNCDLNCRNPKQSKERVGELSKCSIYKELPELKQHKAYLYRKYVGE